MNGQIPEWPKGTDCKSAANCFGGSNPPLPIVLSGRKALISSLWVKAFEHRWQYSFFHKMIAGVAELADAQDLKSCCRNTVPVRFRSPAFVKSRRNVEFTAFLFFLLSGKFQIQQKRVRLRKIKSRCHNMRKHNSTSYL